MAFCLDASFMVAALLPHPQQAAARQLLLDNLRRGERFLAPPLLLAETTSVMRRFVHVGDVEHTKAVVALRYCLALPIVLLDEPSLYLRALELAQRLGHGRAYDTQYLAAAEAESATLVTLDSGLYTNARRLGIPAELIA